MRRCTKHSQSCFFNTPCDIKKRSRRSNWRIRRDWNWKGHISFWSMLMMLIYKEDVKLSLCILRKRRWWSEGKAPRPGRFTHTESTRGTHWIDLVGPQSRCERFREVLLLQVIEPRYLGCSASSLVTTSTTLARLWLTAINRNTEL